MCRDDRRVRLVPAVPGRNEWYLQHGCGISEKPVHAGLHAFHFPGWEISQTEAGDCGRARESDAAAGQKREDEESDRYRPARIHFAEAIGRRLIRNAVSLRPLRGEAGVYRSAPLLPYANNPARGPRDSVIRGR